MEEFEKLLSKLEERLDDLDNKKESVERELEDIQSKDTWHADSDRIALLEEFIDTFDNNCMNVIMPKYNLLRLYLDAKKRIEILRQNDFNNGLRAININRLIDSLKTINESIYNPYGISDGDIMALYNNRDDVKAFSAELDNVNTAVENDFSALLKEVNEEIDNIIDEYRKIESTRTIDYEDNPQSKSKVNKKRIAAIIGGLIGITALVIVLRSCSKDKNKGNENVEVIPTQPTYTIEPTIAPTVKPTVVPTVKPTAAPTIVPTVKPTAAPTAVPTSTVNPIDLANKEADMLRRASLIANTNFFEDAYPSDIVGVLNAIHSKEMWATENATYAQTFNATFNRIYEHYIMGTLNQDDLNKLDALKDLTKDNSDLDRFLETYCSLLKDVLTNKNDAHTKMRRFIEIFGTSLNGFTNEPTLLTDDEVFNENAQVNDFFDWWFAYDSIIKPTYPLLYPKELYNIDGAIIEEIMYKTYGATETERKAYIVALGLGEYVDYIYDYIRLLETQMLMESALTNHPMFCQISHITEGPVLGLVEEEGGNN